MYDPEPQVTHTTLPVNAIVYDHASGLFPFSPRASIDTQAIEQLRQSIRETGLWQPIIVRAETYEGIAGNHRFLAYLDLAAERHEPNPAVPVALVECDEGTAIAIALAENELRTGLSQWDYLRSITAVNKAKPRLAQTVFKVDDGTVEQMRLWSEETDEWEQMAKQQRSSHARLTREWLSIVHERLGDHPELHAQFLARLREPHWVQAHTLEDLDRSITDALLREGIQFVKGATWNAAPTQKCLGGEWKFDTVVGALRHGSQAIELEPDGSCTQFCPNLRLSSRYVKQFVPTKEGTVLIRPEHIGSYPADTVTADGQVQGYVEELLVGVEAYCTDPNVAASDSCFRCQEKVAAEARVNQLQTEGLQAILQAELTTHKNGGNFVWLDPVRDWMVCTPETCIHASDAQPGYCCVAHPDGSWDMYCVHAECGGAAQEVLRDQEFERQRQEAEQKRKIEERLRYLCTAKTLFSSDEKRTGLFIPALMDALETRLVPEWDTVTMMNVVLGWQAGIREELTAELRAADPAAIQRAYRAKCGALAAKPTDETVREMFRALRGELVQTEQDWERWIACLTVIKTWCGKEMAMDQLCEAIAEVEAL